MRKETDKRNQENSYCNTEIMLAIDNILATLDRPVVKVDIRVFDEYGTTDYRYRISMTHDRQGWHNGFKIEKCTGSIVDGEINVINREKFFIKNDNSHRGNIKELTKEICLLEELVLGFDGLDKLN